MTTTIEIGDENYKNRFLVDFFVFEPKIESKFLGASAENSKFNYVGTFGGQIHYDFLVAPTLLQL